MMASALASLREMAHRIEVVACVPGEHLVACAGAQLIVFSDVMSVAEAEAMRRALTQLTAQHGRVGVLVLVGAHISFPVTPDVRTSISKVVNRFRDHIAAAAVVHAASGFKATLLRSVVTAINLAGVASYPCRVFPELQPALVWLDANLPASVTPRPAEFASTLEALRASFHTPTR